MDVRDVSFGTLAVQIQCSGLYTKDILNLKHRTFKVKYQKTEQVYVVGVTD